MKNSLESTIKNIKNIALDIDYNIRKEINKIPREQRGNLTNSILKPEEGEKSKLVDAKGEEIGFRYLKFLNKILNIPIGIIIDPKEEKVYEIGRFGSQEVVWCYFDPVDGTLKLSGLGNDPKNNIYRVGNNGCWASGIAFTLPTNKDIRELKIEDFIIAGIVDGNPTQYRSYPTNAICYPDSKGNLRTFEKDEKTNKLYPLLTSTQTNLGQATVLLDNFQAYDRNTAQPGSEELAVEIYRRISNRNEDGAFDIVRMYTNLGELLRQNLEREGMYEPQGIGAITINENLSNLIPTTPVIEGAGGYVVDFEGNPIRERYLTSERPNVIIAANETIQKKLLDIVKDAEF